MTRTFEIRLDWDPGEKVYVASVPALNDLSTFGATREQAIEAARDAIVGFVEASRKEGMPLPPAVESEVVRLEIAI